MKVIEKRESIKLNHFGSLHIWLLIPFLISVAGFMYSYYLVFTDATFHQHVHGISATLWYVFIIIQPYLIVKKNDYKNHRKLGIVGVVLAGVVAGSALTIIPLNINNVAELDPDGFFNPTFAYFAVYDDIIIIAFYIVSVVMALINVKKLSNHVQWLLASIFFVLSPGLLRLLGVGAILLNNGDIKGLSMTQMAIPTFIGMMALIILFYYKFGSFKHISFKLLVIAHIPTLFVEWIGNNLTLRTLSEIVFKV